MKINHEVGINPHQLTTLGAIFNCIIMTKTSKKKIIFFNCNPSFILRWATIRDL